MTIGKLRVSANFAFVSLKYASSLKTIKKPDIIIYPFCYIVSINCADRFDLNLMKADYQMPTMR